VSAHGRTAQADGAGGRRRRAALCAACVVGCFFAGPFECTPHADDDIIIVMFVARPVARYGNRDENEDRCSFQATRLLWGRDENKNEASFLFKILSIRVVFHDCQN
jgi:hypothetical protein